MPSATATFPTGTHQWSQLGPSVVLPGPLCREWGVREWGLRDWVQCARDLLTFSSGPPGGSGSSGSGSTETETVAEPTAADLENLMIEHADAAYRVALSITRNHDLAEDVTQDAMLKAWQALPSFRGDAPLRNWVLRITHNTAISALRSRREILQDPTEMPEEQNKTSLERQAHGRMALGAFAQALDDLDDLTRSIVVLREVESMSYEEICDILDVPLPTVKTRLLRARRQLATALDGWRS